MNINNYPVTLKKGTVIGYCSTVSSIIKDVNRDEPSPSRVPERLRHLIKEACKDLSRRESGSVEELIRRYQDVFEIQDGVKGKTDFVQHRIDTGNATPIRQVARRLPLAKKQEAKKIIEEMAKDGVIEPSSSPWASPVVLVKKKDGSTRFFVVTFPHFDVSLVSSLLLVLMKSQPWVGAVWLRFHQYTPAIERLQGWASFVISGD